MPLRAPSAERELSDEEALALLRGETPAAPTSALDEPELSDADALKALSGAVPTSNPLQWLAGSTLEGMAAIPEIASVATKRVAGADQARSAPAQYLGKPGMAPAAPKPPLQGFLEDWAGGLRGAAETVDPAAARGRGGVGEDITRAGGSLLGSAPALAAGPEVAALQFGAQSAVPLYYDVLQSTKDPEAATWALLFGYGVGQLERFGAEKALSGIVKKLSGEGTREALERVALATGMGMLEEAGTEGVQTAAEDVIFESLTDEERDIWEDVMRSLPPSLALGGGAAAVHAAIGRGEARHQVRQGPQGASAEGPSAPSESASPAANETVAPAPLQTLQEAPESTQAPEAPLGAPEEIAQPVAGEAASGREGTYRHTDEPASNSSVQPGDKLSRVYEMDLGQLREFNQRKRVEERKVHEIMEAMERGEALPPVIASRGGPADAHLTIDDGSHRIEAARRLGYGKVPVRVVYPKTEAPTIETRREADAVAALRELVKLWDPMEGGGSFDAVDQAARVIENRRAAGVATTKADKALGELVAMSYERPADLGTSEERAQSERTEALLERAKGVLAGYGAGRAGGPERRATQTSAPNLSKPASEGKKSSEAPATVVEMMAGPPSPFGRAAPLTSSKIKKALRKWFTSPGDVPRGARRDLEIVSGTVRSEITEAARAAKSLDRAMRKAEGAKWRGTESARQVDAAFEGDETALLSLPEEAQAAVADMRAHLDRLIRSQVKEGGVIDPKKAPDFAKRILESQGTYARRSYRAHMDPEWADKVPSDVRQRTADLFRSMPEFSGASDADIEAEIDAIIEKAKESADNPWQHLASGKLGRKDLSIYKARKDVPAEIRALLGEVEDPIANYANSVVKIASVVAKHEAYSKIRKEGLGNWIFEKPTKGHSSKLASEGNKSLGPLDGLYTSPEIKAALREVSPTDQGLLVKALMRVNAGIKWGKVIGQPWAFMRNLQSNVGLVVANGHLPGFFRSSEWKAAFGKGDLAELKRLQRLGVVGSGTSTAEWQDLRDSLAKTPEELVRGEKGPVAGAMRLAERAYEAADNAPKIRFFYAEEAYLKKAGYSDARAEEIAADRTRDLMPTTERMAEVFKRFRKQPLLGAYFAFKAEVVRTFGNRLRLIAQEIKSPNAAERAMGYRRAAGQLLAATAAPAAVYAFNALNGIDAEEDEDKKEFVPPWDRGSLLVWFGGETKGQYLDISDVDPFSMLTEPLARVLGGEPANRALKDWAAQEAEAFIGLSPFVTASAEILSKHKIDTDPIIALLTDETVAGAPIDDRVAHLFKAAQPGFIAAARRVKEGGSSSAEEAASAVIGFRRYDFDAEKSLGFDIGRFGRQIEEVTKAKNRQSKRSPEEAAEFTAVAERERKTLFEELSRKTQAAIRLGVPVSRVRKMLDDSLSREVTNAILLGRYIPHRPRD